MNILFCIIFLILGMFLQFLFQLLEDLVIYLYSNKGVTRNSKLFQIPFEILYWIKLPVVSVILYYLPKFIPYHFNLVQIIFNFSVFAIGMYVINEYLKEIRR